MYILFAYDNEGHGGCTSIEGLYATFAQAFAACKGMRPPLYDTCEIGRIEGHSVRCLAFARVYNAQSDLGDHRWWTFYEEIPTDEGAPGSQTANVA